MEKTRNWISNNYQEVVMPRGSKESYSPKQKRMAEHIEESEKKEGKSAKAAARIGWATVNKKTGGAKGKKASSTAKKTASKRTKH
jgi:hypothetical protein